MSVPLLGFIASACGVSREDLERVDAAQTGTPQKGGTIRAGTLQPSGALDPVTVADQGGLGVLGQSGEYLIWSDKELKPQPRLAESWEPLEDGQKWRFKLRQGVTFHDGQPLRAADVAATFNRLADPDAGSNALSVFSGVLSKGNAKAVDDSTVEFQLDAKNGNFPYLVSSDNYNAIVLPESYEGDWEKTFIGTGPWKLEQFRPGQGVSYVRNPDYWDKGRIAVSDKSEVRFYTNEQSLVFGLQGNEVDMLVQFSVAGGKALLTDPDVRTIELKASAHRQVHLRKTWSRSRTSACARRWACSSTAARSSTACSTRSPTRATTARSPRSSPRPPRSTAARPGRAQGEGAAGRRRQGGRVQGPAQRLERLRDARPRAADPAGRAPGRHHHRSQHHRRRHLLRRRHVRELALARLADGDHGVRAPRRAERAAGRALLSKGTWNGAHFKNPQYDELVKDYMAAVDLDDQRRYAKQIQELLLDETPILFTYFYYYLTGAKSDVADVDVTAMGHYDLSRTGRVA